MAEQILSETDDDLARRVDRHVGGRIRLRRKLLGRSQTSLGQALGVSFQQVQKYEHGTSPVNAAKLVILAKTLAAPIGYFFEGLDAPLVRPKASPDLAADRLEAFMGAADAGDWICAVGRLQAPRVRRELLQLIRAMAALD